MKYKKIRLPEDLPIAAEAFTAKEWMVLPTLDISEVLGGRQREFRLYEGFGTLETLLVQLRKTELTGERLYFRLSGCPQLGLDEIESCALTVQAASSPAAKIDFGVEVQDVFPDDYLELMILTY